MMKMKLDINGEILGNSRIVICKGDYVKKHYFQTSSFSVVQRCTHLMKQFHPDLFVDEILTENMLTVVMKKIDHIKPPVFDYRTNIQNYLELYKFFGNTAAKRDLIPANILYTGNGNEFYLIDWDHIQIFKSNSHCYQFYKEQLCDHRWQDIFQLDRSTVENIFEEEWQNVQ